MTETFRAKFSDGHVAVGTNKARHTHCADKDPTHAWRIVMVRKDGSLYEESGFCIRKDLADRSISNLRRLMRPREPTFAEVVEAEPLL